LGGTGGGSIGQLCGRLTTGVLNLFAGTGDISPLLTNAGVTNITGGSSVNVFHEAAPGVSPRFISFSMMESSGTLTVGSGGITAASVALQTATGTANIQLNGLVTTPFISIQGAGGGNIM